MTALLAAAALAAIPGAAAGKGGAYASTAHGRRDVGVARVPGLPRGECGHCHGAPRDATGRRRDEGRGHAQLFSANDNTLCLGCHESPRGSWLGARAYGAAAHGTSSAALWPGPQPRGRTPLDAGKCVNCHDPHGVKDRAGLVPDLLALRGAALCLGCHGGDPAADVGSAFSRVFRHPLLPDPGAVAAQDAVARIAELPAATTNGAAGCEACHNPHAAGPGLGGARGREEPGALLGTSRVRVSNGPPGSPPVTTPVAAGTPGAVREFELCFKCHASATDRALARLDVGVALNPANASYHPVEARGRSPSIDRRAFAGGWSADRLVTCSDCHSSDDEVTRGPHGSAWPHILKHRYAASLQDSQPLETDLCFECHAWRTYGDPLAGAEVAYSRFPYHASHAAKGLSCWGCHDAHGSPTLPALLALRSPGLRSLSRDPTGSGGTCSTTCHDRTPASLPYRPAGPR